MQTFIMATTTNFLRELLNCKWALRRSFQIRLKLGNENVGYYDTDIRGKLYV